MSTPKPKAMSSRLLTMKFMQRAAAASPVSSAPSTPDQPSPKRQRIDLESSPVDINELADQRAVAAALAEEERIREAAIERQAAQAGDTRWVLSFEDSNQQSAVPKNSLRVVKTGFAGIDNAKPIVTANFDSEPIAAGAGGRRSFGKFNRTIEKLNNPNLEDSSDDSSDDEDAEDDDENSDDSEEEDDDTSALIKAERLEAVEKAKAERKAAKKAAKKEASRLADLRKKKEVNLNKVTSISGTGGGGGAGPGPCYTCGQKGHMARDCPKGKGDRRRSGDDFRGQPPSKKARQSR